MVDDGAHRDRSSREEASAEAARGSSVVSTGTRLREARLRRGLTIAESATDTRINPAYLEAMEAERWELLPAPVYARGFLRSYARYLRFAPDEIEVMVPRSLPRPRDLEPAPGLRRSAAQPALSLPSFGWLRGNRDPRPNSRAEVRPAGPLGGVRATASTSVGSTLSARAPRPSTPLARATRVGSSSGGRAGPGTTAGTEGALARLRATGSAVIVEASRGLALARTNPTVLTVAVVAALVLGAGVYALSGSGSTTGTSTTTGPSSGTRATASPAPTVSRQLAGPEPASTPVAVTATPTSAPPREGGMPDLTGMTRRDAEDELNRRGLAFVVIEVATPAAEPGTVYNQSPQPGRDVKRGDSVTLLVARAP